MAAKKKAAKKRTARKARGATTHKTAAGDRLSDAARERIADRLAPLYGGTGIPRRHAGNGVIGTRGRGRGV